MEKFNEQVLQMLKEGRVSVEDAQKLINSNTRNEEGSLGANLMDAGVKSVKEALNYLITLELPEDMRAKKTDIDLTGIKKMKLVTHKNKLRIKSVHAKNRLNAEIIELYIPKEHLKSFDVLEDGTGLLRYRV